MFYILIIPFVVEIQSWSSDTHREITRIAWDKIKVNRIAKKFLRDNLGTKEDIIESSTWADSVPAETAYPGSAGWHFSNTPYRKCSPFQIDRDCGSLSSRECIVTAIADMVLMASDPTTSEQKRADALKFIIHLIGDIHQPLHTGFRADAGGGAIDLVHDPPMDLHSLWDYGLFVSEIPGKSDVKIPTISSIKPPSISGISREALIDYASALASESSTLFTCDFAYTNELGKYIESGDRLSREYMGSRKAVARQRLVTAGTRLGELLEMISAIFAANRPKLNGGENEIALKISNLKFGSQYDTLPDEEGTIIERAGPSRSLDAFQSTAQNQPRDDSLDDENLLAPVHRDEYGRIGSISVLDMWIDHLDDFTSTYSCAKFYKNSNKYEILNFQEFHVRFVRAKKEKTETYVLFMDIECFGVLKATDLNEIFTHEMKSDVDDYVHGNTLRVTEIPRRSLIDFDALRRESVFRCSTGTVRSWGSLKSDSNESLHVLLKQLEMDATRVAVANTSNSTIEKEWDREFVSHMRSVLVLESDGPFYFVIHRDTMVNGPTSLRKFMVFPCVLQMGKDKKISRRLVVDTKLFDGRLTQNIMRLIRWLNDKDLRMPDTTWRSNRMFLHEIVDIQQIFNNRDLYRKFSKLIGFRVYAIPGITDMAYIEYDVKY